MTDKERLTEILKKFNTDVCQITHKCGYCEFGDLTVCESAVADHLLANGVIVPPCKVGDTVWLLYTDGFIEELEVDGIAIGKNCDTIAFTNGSCFTVWGKDYNYYFKWVFPTKEEAEKALAERGTK